jgi:hypothetical protein
MQNNGSQKYMTHFRRLLTHVFVVGFLAIRSDRAACQRATHNVV